MSSSLSKKSPLKLSERIKKILSPKPKAPRTVVITRVDPPPPKKVSGGSKISKDDLLEIHQQTATTLSTVMDHLAEIDGLHLPPIAKLVTAAYAAVAEGVQSVNELSGEKSEEGKRLENALAVAANVIEQVKTQGLLEREDLDSLSEKLLALAQEIALGDKRTAKEKHAKRAGIALEVIGAALAVGGIIAAPFTFGASLGLSIAGAVIAGAVIIPKTIQKHEEDHRAEILKGTQAELLSNYVRLLKLSAEEKQQANLAKKQAEERIEKLKFQRKKLRQAREELRDTLKSKESTLKAQDKSLISLKTTLANIEEHLEDLEKTINRKELIVNEEYQQKMEEINNRLESRKTAQAKEVDFLVQKAIIVEKNMALRDLALKSLIRAETLAKIEPENETYKSEVQEARDYYETCERDLKKSQKIFEEKAIETAENIDEQMEKFYVIAEEVAKEAQTLAREHEATLTAEQESITQGQSLSSMSREGKPKLLRRHSAPVLTPSELTRFFDLQKKKDNAKKLHEKTEALLQSAKLHLQKKN